MPVRCSILRSVGYTQSSGGEARASSLGRRKCAGFSKLKAKWGFRLLSERHVSAGRFNALTTMKRCIRRSSTSFLSRLRDRSSRRAGPVRLPRPPMLLATSPGSVDDRMVSTLWRIDGRSWIESVTVRISEPAGCSLSRPSLSALGWCWTSIIASAVRCSMARGARIGRTQGAFSPQFVRVGRSGWWIRCATGWMSRYRTARRRGSKHPIDFAVPTYGPARNSRCALVSRGANPKAMARTMAAVGSLYCRFVRVGVDHGARSMS